MDSLSEFNPREDLDDVPQFSLAQTLSGHNDSVPAVKFSQDGSKIASGSSDCTAKIWDVENGKMINNLSQHTHGISDVGWNWDGVTLATASDDHSAKLWDIRSPGKAIRVLEGHTHHVTSCSFALSGNMVVTGSFDETMRLWDVRNGKCIGVIPAHGDPIMSVQFSTESSKPVIASASLDGCCRIWSSHTRECLVTIVPDTTKHIPVVCARFTPNNKYILLSLLDSTIRLFDFDLDGTSDTSAVESSSGVSLKKTYTEHLNQRFAVQSTFMVKTADNSKYVISGSEDHHIYIWDLNSRVCKGVLRGKSSPDAKGDGHCDVVLGLDPSRASSLLASSSGSADCTVKLWSCVAATS